ncbi:MAG: helix-turn-helix domain-containing protein [Candidatus Omnitrophica bacterium]|nr:helix-turn-helix domain-containing protein [Candidatus Omnitrophota bacterium]MBU2044381.1 helix-turn-helix domain-containing protein [Candidatus Omnitrophota bacterium]MBU2251081.1 helix-turn-helix domain-containing protein [Candidatus Omnitrophota bacterium]MBU2266379.1 helix-turn-helix domain-containing protein [Candidatus Omnitrophota bacterium]MBU2473845.1 helix-turn-helix domain-containing protein [Candidatus Omnitrophota bacterium]
MAQSRYFTVEEIAKELGISKQTVIRYESRGIFPRAKRNPINRWRQYTLNDVKSLRRILGFS